jgi:glycosyltransferase involved in cell wall biosynthesis
VNIGYLLPGFSAHTDDWAIPVQQELVRLLAQRYNLRVITLRYPHTKTPYTLEGAAVYPLGAGQTRGMGRFRLWREAWALIRRLHAETPFDVLHATWADETGLIAVWAGRELGISSVVSIVGGELVGLRDIDYGLQRGAFSRWIVRQALKADRLIPISPYQRRLLRGMTDERLRIIPFGVNVQRFSPDETQRDPNRLIHVGSLVPVKGQETMLKAFSYLPTSLQLDIIGTGVKEAELRTLAQHLNIDQRVHFRGAVRYPDLPHHHQRAALHVLSSRHEGQGLVTLEAAACGIATAGTAVGILADDNELGLIVPIGDDFALANAIETLLNNASAAYGQRARERVQTNYRIEQTVDQIEGVYQELV